MRNILPRTLVLALLLCLSPGCLVAKADAIKPTCYVIEDAESRNPQSYYDLKTPVLEITDSRFAQGTKSIHFITGNTSSQSIIAKLTWPAAQDFSDIAKDGFITLELWVRNPENISEADGGKSIEFTIGNTRGQSAQWRIGASLLKPGMWNSLILKLKDSKATLEGSSVNTVALAAGDPANHVETGSVDWSLINSHRLTIPSNDVPVEGYLDGVIARVVDRSYLPHKTTTLSATDPTSHLKEANDAAKPNVYWPKYDMIPPDIRKDAFFDDDILKWYTVSGWKADFYNCENEVFCLSMDQAISGKQNAKIEMKATSSNSYVVMRPPSPMLIDEDFDIIDLWIYGRYHTDTKLAISFELKDGSVYRWSGWDCAWLSPGTLFHCWSLAHIALPRIIERGAKLVSIELAPPGPGEYLYHLDQMRVVSFKKYLATTPAPKYPHVGTPVKLPVSPDGACPKTTEPVKTSVSMKNGIGFLKYTTARGEDITYTYSPRTGTLSDLSVEMKGKSTFKPAEGSGPVLEYFDKLYSSAAGDCKVKFVSGKVDGDGLVYVWKYITPRGAASVTYRFSLRGKTLVVRADSKERAVATWLFGHATGCKDAKVVVVPYMSYSPNVLCSDGMFTTYYADWYVSNVGRVPYSSANSVSGDTAYYGFSDPGYHYDKRTDGKRYPFRERFYITVSSKFDDCMLSISNPPSPFKDVLKERVYKMASPGLDWVDIAKRSVDLYDKYGITNIYYLFHAAIFSNKAGRGPEPWHSRMTTSIATKGGDQGVIDLFKYMKSKGMYPGYYSGFNYWEPISSIWDYNSTAWYSDGNWQATWVQAYHMKPWYFPELAATFTKEQAKKFGPMAIYEDGWTVHTPCDENDYDHRIPGSGRMMETIVAEATGYRNMRQSIGGPIFSEGKGNNFYTAGLNDGDYSKLPDAYDTALPDQTRIGLLLDFQLRKVHPLHSPVGNNLCYCVYARTDVEGGDLRFFYPFLASQIAFGTIGTLEPYSVITPEPNKLFASSLTSYFMMQQIQKRYVMEEVEDIRYFDGEKLMSTSEAVLNGKYNDNMVYAKYKNGLEIWVNVNWDKKNWVIQEGGKKHDLPPGGWYAKQGNGFIEYSALVDGRRVDFVDSPEYTYINANGKSITLAGLTTDKVVVSHKSGRHKGKIISFPEQ